MKLQASGKSSTWFVYQKIVIVFIVLLLPLITMSLWLNFKGMSISKDAILDSSFAGASFYSKQLDDEMYFIRNLQLELLNDQDLQKLGFRGGTLDNYEEVALIDQIRERLATLMVSSEYVLNTGVYVESVGKTISTTSGVTNTPNAEMELISSLLSIEGMPSFYRSGDRIFFIETENNGKIWSYIEIARPKLLEALKEIAKLYPESEVLLGSPELGSVLATEEEPAEAAGILGLAVSEYMQSPETPTMGSMHGVDYFIIQNDVSSLGLKLIMYVNQNEITRPLSQFITWFYTLFIIALIVLILYSFSVNLMIHRPLSKLVKAFHMLETDNLDITIESKSKDEFHYVFNSFNNMTLKLKHSIEENYEQKMALQLSQLKQLQSQINPHFLYNSFFNIYMMCKVNDAESAAELSQKLGSYYQYITRSGSDEVPFDKEYRHALDYCDIQCIRFSNRIAYEYGGPSGIPPAFSVPRLIIQPIVENVFEHAFADGMDDGMIYINADYRDGRLRVTVEDNGRMVTDERIAQLGERLGDDSKQLEKTGLINVHNRLRLKYGPESGLFISRSDYGGLKVELIIIEVREEAS
ncbi:histidine kinase [Paenibacillus ihbetae]|uniref:Two-component sensor histidine kinase n=1 Tax=Paenibacillus ihbetae TaxID=1870820 RepID=A0ABX3JUC2_9BACL|nr:histidine kinase [Paenibacillus ihbetae]OOC61280.1 two-component sensor histidine kinase [Paenibacillus ihbetae]